MSVTRRSHALLVSLVLAVSVSVILVAFWVVTLTTGVSSNGLLIVLATATGVAWVAATVIWAVHRLESAVGASTPQAVELGRQLERLRHHQPYAKVLKFPPRRPVGR